MKQQPPEGVSASPIGDDNLLVWGGTVFGPDDTPWEGGIFSLRMTFTEQYPDKPPRVRFTSEMVRALATSRARSRRRAPGCIVPCVRPRLLPAASRMRRGSADSAETGSHVCAGRRLARRWETKAVAAYRGVTRNAATLH